MPKSEAKRSEPLVNFKRAKFRRVKRIKPFKVLKTKLKNEIALEIHFGAIFFMLYYII